MKHSCPMCGEQWNDDRCGVCGWHEGKQPRYSEPRPRKKVGSVSVPQQEHAVDRAGAQRQDQTPQITSGEAIERRQEEETPGQLSYAGRAPWIETINGKPMGFDSKEKADEYKRSLSSPGPSET